MLVGQQALPPSMLFYDPSMTEAVSATLDSHWSAVGSAVAGAAVGCGGGGSNGALKVGPLR